MVRFLHALHQCHYDSDSEAAKLCAYRVVNVNPAWLTRIMSAVLQSIELCLEHLLRFEKKSLMEDAERGYCDLVMLASHLELRAQSQKVLIPRAPARSPCKRSARTSRQTRRTAIRT